MMIGASDRTLQEMATALSLPKEYEAIQDYFTTLSDQLRASKTELLTANKVFVRKNFKINPEFINIANNNFNAEIENLDFTRA